MISTFSGALQLNHVKRFVKILSRHFNRDKYDTEHKEVIVTVCEVKIQKREGCGSSFKIQSSK